MNKSTLPSNATASVVMASGYRKLNHRLHGRLYVGMVAVCGKPRMTRWFFKRAQQAVDYAKKVAARWQKMFGEYVEVIR